MKNATIVGGVGERGNGDLFPLKNKLSIPLFLNKNPKTFLIFSIRT